MQAHGKPVFLWGREGGESLRGSCRSDGGVSVVSIMENAADMFEHFGGHTASGGFAVPQEKIHELLPRLVQSYAKLATHAPTATEVLVDRELSVAEVPHAHKHLRALSPFGMQNEKPLFLFPRVTVRSVRTFGKAKDHLELHLEQGSGEVAGVSFFSTPDSYQKKAKAGVTADVVAHVETDWRGGPRLRVVDVL
jgi:single-stranded-DNA-specific exonuclease